MKIQIAGTGSGLGKFLFNRLDYFSPYSLKRGEKVENGLDLIIDCSLHRDESNIKQFVYYNTELINKIVDAKPKKIIHFSSIKVYKKSTSEVVEDSQLAPTDLYSFCKIYQESVIEKNFSDFLILRPSSFCDASIKRDNLFKLISSENMTVSGDSTYNLIGYSQVLDFLKLAISKNINGIFNICNNDRLKMSEISNILGKNGKFGNFRYETDEISNKKVNSVCNIFDKKSSDTLKEYEAQYRMFQ